MAVFVLDRSGKPLMPCTEKRAKMLLQAKRARVHRLFPFTIRVVDRKREDSVLQSMRLSIDPGSKSTGLAVARIQEEGTGPILHVRILMELVHRGSQIREALAARRSMRRSRRGRKTRYRRPRFLNRTKPKGWLAPSLQHRVDTTTSWVKRLCRLAPITHLAQELVRFDMQRMQNPEISGVEYQQGALAGYELREYLLEKWGRKCAYCDGQDIPLQIEHIVPKAKGGSNRASNLTLACRPCNERKAALPLEVFLRRDPQRLARITSQAQSSLKDAAAVNSTRWALFQALSNHGLPFETGSGGRTKFNRCRFGIPKSHALDAACVGNIAGIRWTPQPTLRIKCSGRGTRSRTRLDAYGFPRGYLMRGKSVHGFRTGDIIKARVPASSKKAGTHIGRVAIRATGIFNIQTANGVVQGISHKYCTVLMRGDGYGYFQIHPLDSSNRKEDENRGVHEYAALSLPGLKAGVSRAT